MSGRLTPASIETLIDILIADPERLATMKYAEMGVPMFVIGEDPASPPGTNPARHRTDSLGRLLVALASVLGSRKPVLDEDDVARLLEVLAERHFFPHEIDPSELVSAAGAGAPSLPAAAPPELADIVAGLANSKAIRVVHFHSTPRYREAEFRQQIEALAREFEPITPANFASAVDGRWAHERPGVMFAVFEGYRDCLDVMVPILEEYGVTGWFFVPSGFLNVPAEEQRDYAAAHQLYLAEQDEYPGERIALTWDEAREIARRGHAFACHTRSHRAVAADTPRAVLENEIVAAKTEMERELGIAVDVFCWLEGAALGVNPEADAMLRDAGFEYLFSNFKIQKLH